MASDRPRAIAIAAALVLASTLAASRAHAEPPAPSATEKETARGLMADARAKRDRGDARGALESFQAADAIMHVPTTGFEVARTQASLGLLVEARDTLHRVLSM